MNCFRHPRESAVATCSTCNKGTCSQCAADIGNATLCHSCAAAVNARLREEQRLRAREIENDCFTEAGRASRRIVRAWIIGGVFGVAFGPLAGSGLASDPQFNGFKAVGLIPLMIAVYFYVGWSFSWSIPVVWNWSRQLLGNRGFDLHVGCAWWVLLLSCAVAIPLSVAYFYGIFGGAIYEYLKARRAVARWKAWQLTAGPVI